MQPEIFSLARRTSELLIQKQLPSGWQKASSPSTCGAMSKHVAEGEVCMRGGSQHAPALCSAWALPSPVPTAPDRQRRAVATTACSLPVPWAYWEGSNVSELEEDSAQFAATQINSTHYVPPPCRDPSAPQHVPVWQTGWDTSASNILAVPPALGSTVSITACTPPAARHILSWAAKSFPDWPF